MTQAALASAAGTTQGRISDIERGLESLDRTEVQSLGAALGDAQGAIRVWITSPPTVARPETDPTEAEILAAYRAADGPAREQVLRVVKALLGGQ